jgi:hypothetical protein
MPRALKDMMSSIRARHHIYYKIIGVGHWFTFTLQPPKFWRNGKEESSTRENTADFETKILRDTAYCCLYSSLHYWLYQARTNCRDFNPSDLQYLPVPATIAEGLRECDTLASELMTRLDETSDVGTGAYAVGGAVRYQKFRPKTAKPLFDEIDQMLAKHYGFTDDELDFIINYDIKYRMGVEVLEEDE